MNSIEIFWTIFIIYILAGGYCFIRYVDPWGMGVFAFVMTGLLPGFIGFLVSQSEENPLPITKVMRFEGTGKVVAYWNKTSYAETMDVNVFLLPDSQICLHQHKRTDAYTNVTYNYHIEKCK